MVPNFFPNRMVNGIFFANILRGSCLESAHYKKGNPLVNEKIYFIRAVILKGKRRVYQ